MADHLDELIALVQSVGGTVKLYGKPVTARDLRSFAWAGFVERYTDVVVRAACTAMVIPRELQWSPYPWPYGTLRDYYDREG